MTLTLTPDVLRAAYDFLRVTQPFNRWKLPLGEEVGFAVTRDRNKYGEHRFSVGIHTIAISGGRVGHTSSLMAVMAHEMAHVAQEVGKTATYGVLHNADFGRRAKMVCRRHGFDSLDFAYGVA